MRSTPQLHLTIRIRMVHNHIVRLRELHERLSDMILADPNSLSRAEIKAAFKRHRGAAAQLARELDIDRQNIRLWMRGLSRSARVDTAVRQRAAELINAERAEAQGK
jgi:hypothetical protein